MYKKNNGLTEQEKLQNKFSAYIETTIVRYRMTYLRYKSRNYIGLCENEESIGFAQCLFKLGETATLNGVKGSVLANDDSDLSFFESPYNNRAHVFAKYYYPPVSACVFTSPVIGKEDKALCYSVSSIDYVFKKNVQVTRAEWGSENTIQMRR